MGAGLDELIESLLNEIAFSGFRGCSVSKLLDAIDSFYKPPDKSDGSADIPRDANTEHDLSVASKVWKWLAARPDVSIGENNQFNHLSLEAILGLPEEAEPPSEPVAGSSTPSASKDQLPAVRPRLHVSEERQWRTITGHGPDLKRVPLYEWRALVDIASVKEKGILQGDLVRLTGQDKRSLPTRTDALAKKGYVIKQPIVLRGGKSSKLWLAQFSENAKEHEEREGLDYDTIDLSKQALTSDLCPVPFCSKWNRETIDYLALAQGFVAIVKAWELIRYCDARAKLGVGERIRQMRALAKTCRWLTNIGSLSFVGAKFAGSNKLFKDCVKYIRDPSPAEWSHFRATPKTRMVVPSGRIGKRGEASRAVHASQPGISRPKATGKTARKTESTPLASHDATSRSAQISIIPSPWKPQKPLPNTAFEIMKRAGTKGTSNAAICRQTLGYNFRRLTSAMTSSISMPTNSQPPHLQHLSSTSQLGRIGKTMTYTFYANSEIAVHDSTEQPLQKYSANRDTATATTTATASSTNDADDTATSHDHTIFSQPDLSRFANDTASSLTDITKASQLNRPFSKKRKRPIRKDLDDQSPADARRPRGRPRIHPIKPSVPSEGHSNIELDITPSGSETQREEPEAHTSQPAERPPGVYRGVPNSLDGNTKRKGRRPRSLVLIFRSDKLKDPSYLSMAAAPAPDVPVGDSPGHPDEAKATSADPEVPTQHKNSTDTSHSTASVPEPESDDEAAPPKPTAFKKKNGYYWCNKCGNKWKNSNGLEYHLTKSRTACNPDFVPPPAELVNRKQRASPRPASTRSVAPRSMIEDHGHHRLTLTAKEQVESRVDLKKPPMSPEPKQLSLSSASFADEGAIRTPHSRAVPQPLGHEGNIVLKDLDVFDASEHRNSQRQQIGAAKNELSTDNEHTSTADSTTDTQPLLQYGHLSYNGHGEAVNSFEDSHGRASGTQSVDGRTNIPATPSTKRPAPRKPLPSAPSKRPDNTRSDTATQPHEADGTEATAENPMVEVQPELPHGTTVPPQSADKSLASFARQTRPYAPLGTIRRARTFQIIEYLLEQNNGVFPGLRSLFMAVISVWSKEFGDLAPPDRRICQNAVNQMEREGKIKQMHFFFFDEHSKMQEIVVLAKADIGCRQGVDLSDDPRVIAVKEKLREMFPEAYVPDAFSLSPDETKLFDELASQGKEHSQQRTLRGPKDTKTVQNIETLRYENSVMGEIPIHRSNPKRPGEDAHVEAQLPAKRPRLDMEQTDNPEKTRKPRKRPGRHELWDSGKLAVYIWSQRQKSDAVWDQNRSCLQDAETGAWSWMPEEKVPQGDRICTILSSVRSARDIDACLKRKNRKGLADTGSAGNKKDQFGDQNSGAVSSTFGEAAKKDTPTFPGASASVPFGLDNSELDVYYDDTDDESSEISGDESVNAGPLTDAPGGKEVGVLSSSHGSPLNVQNLTNLAVARLRPGAPEHLKGNRTRDGRGRLNTARRTPSKRRANLYGEFLRDVKTIQKWETSAESPEALREMIAPESDYISLTVSEARAMKPTTLEWLSTNQFTVDNIPDEVKNAPREDENYGLSYLAAGVRKKVGKTGLESKAKNRKASKSYHPRSQGISGGPQSPVLPHSESLKQREGFIEYKTRDLTPIPRQPRGRFNKPTAHDEKLGNKREDELLAACVAFRTLLGGLDRNLDIGLLLKYFPGISLSAIKKFWPRVRRERKSYVQALTKKFQSAFLEAYEKDELPPLDYDKIEEYDWPRLIKWTMQLETHEDINLPASRQELEEKYYIEDANNEATDWRETWFSNTSTFNRIEAVASEAMSIAVPVKPEEDRAVLDRARTWVRSICCTALRGVNVVDRLIPRLVELGNGDVDAANKILQKTVTELNEEKVITKTKGKEVGGNFRLHGMFSKQLEKLASVSKFRQAALFKTQLDDAFRRGEEFLVPYASDDGSVMAVLNLQAHGRIRIEPVDMPQIPFGFEPGNYEGRTFPKSYYHFRMRLEKTDSYLYNEDMALLKQARDMGAPAQGPDQKIPIWVDFFGKVNPVRWADYVSMVVFILSMKGPMSPAMCVTLLKPMIEEFEVQLIIEWLDKLGVLQRAVAGCGVTGAEWWWLVAGDLVLASDKLRAEATTAGNNQPELVVPVPSV
ncbi:hypothetical protein GGR50DRAFT_96026 [Xylaria sp. CBS 124048]|nr:hypothetical protein GGR50DRAFT_96026 [Xylaria sp. CBS 124048]